MSTKNIYMEKILSLLRQLADSLRMTTSYDRKGLRRGYFGCIAAKISPP